ncbi:hypothetical protein [Roseiconus nitratireducens]|nr:hypothetical protein [Roseiconus nitratireducens]
MSFAKVALTFEKSLEGDFLVLSERVSLLDMDDRDALFQSHSQVGSLQ